MVLDSKGIPLNGRLSDSRVAHLEIFMFVAL